MLNAHKGTTCNLSHLQKRIRIIDFEKIPTISVIQMKPIFRFFWAKNQKNTGKPTMDPPCKELTGFARTIFNKEALAFPLTRICSPISL